MPIVALILSTLAIWTIYWFFRMGGIDHILARRAQRRDADRLNRARASERSAPLRMTQARFITSRADGFAQADLFNKKLTIDEKCQLVAMVEQVANLDGRSQAHEEALDVLVRRVGLAPAR